MPGPSSVAFIHAENISQVVTPTKNSDAQKCFVRLFINRETLNRNNATDKRQLSALMVAVGAASPLGKALNQLAALARR